MLTLEHVLRSNITKNDLQEDIEIHSELNPKLFDSNNDILPEVKEKIEEIIKAFSEYVNKKEIKINIEDVVILGSNANYNYNNDSDLDLHIIINDKEDCREKHLLIIYDVLKSMFNDRYDISINGINTEIYVETDYKSSKASGGIYSIINNEWINKPSLAKIPKIDQAEVDKRTKQWGDKYKDILKNPSKENIDNFTDSIHDIRKEDIIKNGEFGLDNLTFKEIRRLGYLGSLKKLKDKLVSQQLSLS